MYLTDLHYLQTIACGGNLTCTARLWVCQPTLTMAMPRHEAEVGSTRMPRDRSGVSLTSAGKVFLWSMDTFFCSQQTPRYAA
jgi:DNA-binding transcriptional LysR family regulator